jgi:hypothetical protein
MLSNIQTIFQEDLQAPWKAFWGSCFSPNDSILYLSRVPQQSGDTSRLYQLDLTAANISSSIDTLWETADSIQLGQMKLAPDKKIYLSSNFYGVYPYADTAYRVGNMNLSVIEEPDILGNGCNLQPFSFYLGGKRTYFGLPNNPDYKLGPFIGSICDTLAVGVPTVIIPKGNFNVFYHTIWNTAFINASGLKNGQYQLSVFDVSGKNIFREEGNIMNHYLTKNMNCSGLSKGMYVITLITEAQKMTTRFIVQ